VDGVLWVQVLISCREVAVALLQAVVPKFAACVLSGALSVAAIGSALRSANLPAGADWEHQRSGRLLFVSRGSQRDSSSEREVQQWVVYLSPDSVSLVLRGAWPDSGNTLVLDVYVRGSPWEKILHGSPLTPDDTAGSWRAHEQNSLRRITSHPMLSSRDRLLMTIWPEQIDAAHSSSTTTVERIRAVLRSASGDSLVATLSTAFAI
jgi:hypothetical protein